MFYKDFLGIYNRGVATKYKKNVWQGELATQLEIYRKGRDVTMNLELGKRIASLRKVHKVTQSELAEYLSVQPQTISRWEAEGGMPDISLLPQIATFFDITLDELFGMTDMERINHLVCKYSVLRDEKSFEEAMRSLEQGISELEEEERRAGQDIDVSRMDEDTEEKITATGKKGKEATTKRQQLVAWKVHMYIQKSRQAIADAEKILDGLMEEVTDAQNPLYLSLRLQKQQFRIQGGEGSTTLRKAREIWESSGEPVDLHCYMAALLDMDNGKAILELWEEERVQKLVMGNPSEAVSQWLFLFYGAFQERNLSVFEKYFPIFEKQVQGDALFSARWNLADLYKLLGMEKECQACKEILLQELKELSVNEFMKQEYMRRISEFIIEKIVKKNHC